MTADPLLTAAAERLAYATGQLLGAEDFAREQTYHRGRLALALRHLVGHGTVAGLRVRHSPAADGRPEELRVEPGVAIDRHGRLLELARPRCLDLARWYDAPEASHIGALERGFDAASGGVVADVFALFEPCPRAPAPRLAAGPFDATDAVGPGRILDSVRLELLTRAERPVASALPQALWPALARDDAAALADAVLDAWDPPADTATGALAPLAEHPPGLDPAAVFLARIVIAADPPAPDRRPPRRPDPPTVDNRVRPFVPPAGLLASVAGVALPPPA
jgi:hypothetical protein